LPRCWGDIGIRKTVGGRLKSKSSGASKKTSVPTAESLGVLKRTKGMESWIDWPGMNMVAEKESCVKFVLRARAIYDIVHGDTGYYTGLQYRKERTGIKVLGE
jgi:hypothetical protein